MSANGFLPSFKITDPASWVKASPGGEVRVAGWFCDAHGRSARQVRVLLGNRVVKAAAVPRSDQITTQPLNLGFYTAFITQPGWKFLRIEAEDEEGRVWKIGTRLLYVRQSGHQRDSYANWVRFYDHLDDTDYAAMRRQSEAWLHPPRFSIILLAANAPVGHLDEAIKAVRAQIYPHWNLSVTIDDTATLSPLLENFARQDPRIQILPAVAVTENQIAQSEFVVWLEASGALRPHALFLLANAVQASPSAAFLYADDDEMEPSGKRRHPNFKPDWNPALLLGHNYLGHFIACRRELVSQLDELSAELATATIWRIALRLAAIVPASAIVHLPYILYHRRSAQTAELPTAKNAALIVEEHLHARGIAAFAESSDGHLRIKFPLPQPAPKVSLLIPSACRLQFLAPCLQGLLQRTDYPDFEILLAVNTIRDRVPEQHKFLTEIARDPRVRVLRYPDQEFNISWIINWAERQATGSILGCLNDDLDVIHKDWLKQLVAAVLQEGVGMTSPILYYPTNTIQHAGVILGVGGLAEHAYRGLPRGSAGYFGRAALAQDVSCVTGACFLVRRSVFAQVGGFRELLRVDYNDVDFCLRVREAGWRILWMPEVELYHHESVSIGTNPSSLRAQSRSFETTWMLEQWPKQLACDPNYSPNLSLTRGLEWQPAFPPRVPQPWRSGSAH